MGEEIKKHALDPFFTGKDVGQGVGLGLSTVYNCFVTNLKGSMVIESKEKVGTKISIEIPIAK